MEYFIALFLFFLGFTAHSELHNQGTIFRQVFPRAAGWAEWLYAIRLLGIFNIAFVLLHWNAPLALGSIGMLAISFRGYKTGAKTEDEILQNVRAQVVSALAIFFGFFGLALLGYRH